MADFNSQQIDSMGYEDDQPEFFQVVKKKSSGENTPAVSAAPGQVLEEEEVFEVVKGKKTKTENAGTIRTASAMPMAENVVAPASTAAAAVPVAAAAAPAIAAPVAAAAPAHAAAGRSAVNS